MVVLYVMSNGTPEENLRYDYLETLIFFITVLKGALQTDFRLKLGFHPPPPCWDKIPTLTENLFEGLPLER